MKALILKIIKDRKVMLLVYILSCIALLWLYVAMFPAFSQQSAGLEQVVKSLPESFLKAFNFDLANYTTLGGFVSTEQFSFVWPLVVIFLVCGLAGYSLAGEIESGTMELILSLPLSRAKIYFTRYFTGLAILIIFVIFSIFAVLPLAAAYNTDISISNVATVSLLGFLFSFAIYSIAFMFSAIFSERGKVYFTTGGILVLMYVLNIIAAIRDNLNDLKFTSFFYYFNPTKAFVAGQIDHWAYLIFIAVVVVSVIVGAVIFNRRDVAV